MRIFIIIKLTFLEVISNRFYQGIFLGVLFTLFLKLKYTFLLMCFPIWFILELIINLIKYNKMRVKNEIRYLYKSK